MSLYLKWKELAGLERNPEVYEKYWKDYFLAEKDNYEAILENHQVVQTGKLSDLAKQFNMDTVVFTGFLDGINTSLVEEMDVEGVDEDTDIKLELDYEKLYFNMLDAKADWLYTLPQWEKVLPVEKRTEITKEFKKSQMAVSSKVGRNDLCPCGSGKKYKKCCGK